MVVHTSRGDWRRSLAGEGPVGLGTLLFAFLGSAAAWAVHFNLIYFLVALHCTTGRRSVALEVTLATVAFLAVSVASGVVAYRAWKGVRGGDGGWEREVVRVGGATSLFLVMGMLAALLFSLLIVAEGLSPFFVPACPEVAG